MILPLNNKCPFSPPLFFFSLRVETMELLSLAAEGLKKEESTPVYVIEAGIRVPLLLLLSNEPSLPLHILLPDKLDQTEHHGLKRGELVG